MVVHSKFFLDDTGQDRRGPDSGVQSVSHRAAFHNVVELLELFAGQLARASAAMALLDPLLAMLVPVAHPSVNAGAMNLEQSGDLGRAVPVGAEQQGLQAQRDAWGFVGLGFLAQGQEFAASAGVGLGEDRVHGNQSRVTNARMMRQRRPAIKRKREEGHLPARDENVRQHEKPRCTMLS